MGMKLIKYLFNHHYYVNFSAVPDKNAAEVQLALANLFGIRIIHGAELLTEAMIGFTADQLGISVPAPFYRGFPESIRSLSIDQLLIDQLLHYYRTYGLGDFSEAGHSIFEEELERKAFKEDVEIRDFSVLTEAEAIAKLKEYAENLLAGSRPLSTEQFEFVSTIIKEYNYLPKQCASKNTAIRLLAELRRAEFADLLMLSDVIKLADELNYQSMIEVTIKNQEFHRHNPNKNDLYPPIGGRFPTQLNLRNRDRRLLTAVIDRLIANGKIDTRSCYEKKALWSGLLHHLHYKAKTAEGKAFLDAMRGGENHSFYSEFERLFLEKGPAAAADVLVQSKGSGALLRNMDYLLSRCRSDEEVNEIIQKIGSANTVILLQMLFHYRSEEGGNRVFRFTRHEKMKKHEETAGEAARRKTNLASRDKEKISAAIMEKIEQKLKNRLGRVYIDPDMKNKALPLQEGSSQGGFGTLPKGSRIPLPPGKKIRAFTYWEKVNDIDLSVLGLDKELNQYEFSWQTMAQNQSEGITFSGDETSGYNGGSEYFDIDPVQFRKERPDLRYLIFIDNIYNASKGQSFRTTCTCRAGYMLRDTEDSGEIFEPKTVKSSFAVNCDSTEAVLFGLDLAENDFVWLNIAYDSWNSVAGSESMAFLSRYFEAVKIFSVYDFFRMMAAEVVNDPAAAEIAVTDEDVQAGKHTEIIRSYDIERITALMNQ